MQNVQMSDLIDHGTPDRVIDTSPRFMNRGDTAKERSSAFEDTPNAELTRTRDRE